MNIVIEAENIQKSFPDGKRNIKVLSDIDLKISQGEFLVLLGPSGSGKSTLLRILTGLIEASSGTIKRSEQIRQAFIFQDFALFPWLTVYNNIAFGLKMKGYSAKEIHKFVSREITTMGLTEFSHNYPRELSGGMKQRVGIARALAMQPNVLFLDEPFSALDSFTANRLRADLLDVWSQKNLTVIMVTHLIEEALELADRIAVISQRPAKIETIVENSLPRPRNKRNDNFFKLYDKINGSIKV